MSCLTGLQNAAVPHDTINGYEAQRDREFVRIGHLFVDFEQFEMFHMLPLEKKQKAALLQRVVELESKIVAEEVVDPIVKEDEAL